jgi:hypothetical protein
MSQRELTRVLEDRGARVGGGGDIYVDQDTDLAALSGDFPNAHIAFKDVNGQRFTFPIQEAAQLVANEAFTDRLREARIVLVGGSRGGHAQFMGGNVDRFLLPDTASANMPPPEPIPGVTLSNNSTISRPQQSKFVDAVRVEAVRKGLQELGITSVSIDPPYRFELSEQANVSGQHISVNADAENPAQSILHELGHVKWRGLSNADRQAFAERLASASHPQLDGYKRLNELQEAYAENHAMAELGTWARAKELRDGPPALPAPQQDLTGAPVQPEAERPLPTANQGDMWGDAPGAERGRPQRVDPNQGDLLIPPVVGRGRAALPQSPVPAPAPEPPAPPVAKGKGKKKKRPLSSPLGPREVGGVYYNGYWNKKYTVLSYTEDPFSITVQYEDSTTPTTHSTAWEPRRDRVVTPPKKDQPTALREAADDRTYEALDRKMANGEPVDPAKLVQFPALKEIWNYGDDGNPLPREVGEDDFPQSDNVERMAEQADAEDTLEFLNGGLGLIPLGRRRLRAAADVVPPVGSTSSGMQPPDFSEQDRRYDANHGLPTVRIADKLKEYGVQLWHRMSRKNEFIPETPEFAPEREVMRHAKDIPNLASAEAVRRMAVALGPLAGPKQMAFLEKYLNLKNWQEGRKRTREDENGVQVPNPDWVPQGWDKIPIDVMDAHIAEMEGQIGASPALSQALANWRVLFNEVKQALDKYNLLPAGANRDWYVHQMVMKYALDTVPGGRTLRPVKRPFQRKRLGEKDVREDDGSIPERPEELDVNTNIFESMGGYLMQSLMEIRKVRILKRLDAVEGNQMKQAKAAAEAWNVANPDAETPHTWRDHIPDGYEAWQPVHGNYFFPAMTIEQAVAMAIQDSIAAGEVLSPADVEMRNALVMGQRRPTFIFRQEVVDQLNSMKAAPEVGPVGKIAQAATRFWQKIALFSPKRLIGYEVRNELTDIEAVTIGAPWLVSHAPRAIKELNALRLGALTKSADLRKAEEYGVLSSGLFTGELRDLVHTREVKRLATPRSKRGILSRYFDWAMGWNNFREGSLRYAAYLWAKEQLQNGKPLVYGGANMDTVAQIARKMGNEIAAAHFARRMLGDYPDLPPAFEWLRRYVMPFGAWKYINPVRWANIAKNTFKGSRSKALRAFPKTQGEGFGQKARRAGAQSAYTAAALSRIGLWGAALFLFKYFNRDEEDQLSTQRKRSSHITMPGVGGKNQYTFGNVSGIRDVADTFGIMDMMYAYEDFQNDQVDWTDIPASVPKGLLNTFVQGVNPLFKLPVEVIFGRTLYPNALESRPAPRGELLANVVGLKDEYKMGREWLLGRGDKVTDERTGTEEAFFAYMAKSVLMKSNPDEAALSDTYDLRNKFLKKQGRKVEKAFSSNEVFMNMKQAAVAGDYDAFEKAKAAYMEGAFEQEDKDKREKSFKDSLKRLDPIGPSMNKDDEKAFAEFQTFDQSVKVAQAMAYVQWLQNEMQAMWDALPE